MKKKVILKSRQIKPKCQLKGGAHYWVELVMGSNKWTCKYCGDTRRFCNTMRDAVVNDIDKPTANAGIGRVFFDDSIHGSPISLRHRTIKRDEIYNIRVL